MPSLPDDILVRRARDADLPEMARLHYAAYPGVSMTLEERISHLRDDPRIPLEDHWVCWKRDAMVGIFALYNYQMMRGGKPVPTGGIGGVAVAPEARRDRIAYWMMAYAIEIMDQNGMPLSLLYPFRHSFYHKLGWGLIGQPRMYRMSPESLPAFSERSGVFAVTTREEQEEVMGCYRRYCEVTNGLLVRDDPVWFERVFKNSLCYAYRNPTSRQLDGYLTYKYRPYPADEAFVSSDLEVRDFAACSDQAMRGLLGFLATQRDQIKIVEFPYQGSLPIEHVLSEPRMPDGRHDYSMGAETAWMGSGLMGRIVQLRRALAVGGFGSGEGRLTLEIADDLRARNTKPLTIEFAQGRVKFPQGGSAPLTLKADMAVFSSIFWGALQVKHAIALGMAEVEGDGSIDDVNDFFAVATPVCLDQF